MRPEWEQAARKGSVEDLEALARDGADLDGMDRYGQTALMLASVRGHSRAVEWLVGQGASLDRTAKFGLSALMLATVNGHLEVVEVLVTAGADRSLCGFGAPGFAGKTAMDLAAERGNSEIALILRTGGSQSRDEAE